MKKTLHAYYIYTTHICVLFFVCFFPHAISFWNIIPGSLLPLFSYGQSITARRQPPPTHLHFPNKTI